MELDKLLRDVGIDDLPLYWRDCWEECRESYHGDSFMDPRLVDLLAASTDLDEGLVDALRRTIDIIRPNDSLLRFAWLWRHCLFEKGTQTPENWYAPQAFGEDFAGMFPLAVLITELPSLLELHKRLGVPEQVTRDTLADIRLWTQHYHRTHGRWGFAEQQWLQNHFLRHLFRLGRLEFVAGTYSACYRVYRNGRDGRVMATAEPGIKFRNDGLVDGTTGVVDPEAWESELTETDGVVRANLISSDGRATRHIVEIRSEEWDVILGRGSKILDVHIPEGAPLDRQACLQSYQMAREFYRRTFPDYSYSGFICKSWLLDPELEKILPEESNIIQFQREFYLMPALSNDSQTFSRVFGERPADLTKAPRDTSLRRAVMDHYLAGNKMSQGFGFIPAEDIDNGHRYTKA